MTATALSVNQHEALDRLIDEFAGETEVDSVVVCETGGNILVQHGTISDGLMHNAAALAAGTFAATRELAQIIGEPGFSSLYHKGKKSGLLIQAVGSGHLIMVILGARCVEGMVRLLLNKVGKQVESVLLSASGQTVEQAGGAASFEVEESAGASGRDA
jgi:predicted regulator of Ras-like GTPase activity (Roadblock/LC7/MglB family)